MPAPSVRACSSMAVAAIDGNPAISTSTLPSRIDTVVSGAIFCRIRAVGSSTARYTVIGSFGCAFGSGGPGRICTRNVGRTTATAWISARPARSGRKRSSSSTDSTRPCSISGTSTCAPSSTARGVGRSRMSSERHRTVPFIACERRCSTCIRIDGRSISHGRASTTPPVRSTTPANAPITHRAMPVRNLTFVRALRVTAPVEDQPQGALRSSPASRPAMRRRALREDEHRRTQPHEPCVSACARSCHRAIRGYFTGNSTCLMNTILPPSFFTTL